jgi:hypothetical protein
LLIEQLQYTTTLRYGIPQILEKESIHKEISELSLVSMHSVKNRKIRTDETSFSKPFLGESFKKESIIDNFRLFPTLLHPLKPIQDDTPIIGLDISSMKIGETEKGVICATRGTVVWNRRKKYQYIRFGPYVFHLTKDNSDEIFSGFDYQTSNHHKQKSFTLIEPHIHLCNLMEKYFRRCIACYSDGNIILWDGSLMEEKQCDPANSISNILELARANLNSVLAFSKTTTLKFQGYKITDLMAKNRPPIIFEIDNLPFSKLNNIFLLGKIYIAKLISGGCSFRLDIDRLLSRKEGIKAVEKILGNELLFQGYPETLRLAHIYSTFTANEVLGIHSYLKKTYNLRLFPSRGGIRKNLFGPYGTGYGD